MTAQDDHYWKGAAEALDTFGVRIAAHHLSQRMPNGPEHLGAEWLAKRLSSEEDDHGDVVGSGSSHRKLEKPPTWGAPTNAWSTQGQAHNSPGLGEYGGV